MRRCARWGDATLEQRRQLLEEHQATIAAQIAALERAHALLTHKIANYRKIEERTRVPNPVLTEPEGEHSLAAGS